MTKLPRVGRLAKRIVAKSAELTSQGIPRSHVNAAASIRQLICQLCECAGLTVEWGNNYATWADSQSQQTRSKDGEKAADNPRPVRSA